MTNPQAEIFRGSEREEESKKKIVGSGGPDWLSAQKDIRKVANEFRDVTDFECAIILTRGYKRRTANAYLFSLDQPLQASNKCKAAQANNELWRRTR